MASEEIFYHFQLKICFWEGCCMLKIFVMFFLFSFQFTFAQRNNEVINVPNGSPLILGNLINQDAWKTARQIKSGGGNEVFVVHDNNFLYVGFRGNYEPWSHLYINNRNSVYVLHITASMGRVVYNLNQYGNWRPDRPFNWKIRKNGQDYENLKLVDSKVFLKKEGWITSVNMNGEKKEIVFKIDIKNFDKNNLYVALVFGFKGTSYLFWPSTLNDDTLKPEIFTGYNPSDLRFNLKNWTLLKFDK